MAVKKPKARIVLLPSNDRPTAARDGQMVLVDRDSFVQRLVGIAAGSRRAQFQGMQIARADGKDDPCPTRC